MRTFKNILLVLATGYIFVYFSEHLFWARIRPEDTLTDWVGAWIAYSLVAYFFLVLVAQFKIKNIWQLFLAGAVFGWLTEGLVVQTAYEMLPLSISFTGLAWHALITVWVGWYAIQKSFFSPASFSTLKLATVIGICSALWAITWWLEPDGGVASIAEYAKFSFVTTFFVILAYGLANWSVSESFHPKPWVTILIATLFALYFLFVTVPAAPIAIILLPILLGLVYLALQKNAKTENNSSLLDQFSTRVKTRKFLGLLMLPIVNVACYALAVTLNLQWHTNWILYLVTMPLGFILFFISLYKSFRAQSAHIL
ncbi:MAG: hypothetical protein IT310_03435 [Anaerolineales bacterium]|nr:hypothetical protein [Anaerolineales bacterium]